MGSIYIQGRRETKSTLACNICLEMSANCAMLRSSSLEQRFHAHGLARRGTVSAEIIETRLIAAAPTHRKIPYLNLD
jgi:hypothetical protein